MKKEQKIRRLAYLKEELDKAMPSVINALAFGMLPANHNLLEPMALEYIELKKELNSTNNEEIAEKALKDFELKHCETCNQMTNHLNEVCQKHKMNLACLCAGLRRRNAGLCLKCEIAFLPTDFPDRFAERDYSYEKGYKDAKNDILRLLE